MDSEYNLKVESPEIADGLAVCGAERQGLRMTPRIEVLLPEMRKNDGIGLFWKEFSFKHENENWALSYYKDAKITVRLKRRLKTIIQNI